MAPYERWPVLDWLGNTVAFVEVETARPPASVRAGTFTAKRQGSCFKVPMPKGRSR